MNSLPPPPETLRLARWSRRCTALGPGVRAVLWVQGCPFRCAGCVAPETLPFEGGELHRIDELAIVLAGLEEIKGVTFSGGEPMAQATALAALIDRLRELRPELGYLSYTGHRLENLRRAGDRGQRALLDRLDVLIDGPFVESLPTEKPWRGSENQRVHFLTDRYREPWEDRVDRPAGHRIEFELNADGSLAWMGIPPRGFRERFERSMSRRGLVLGNTAPVSSTVSSLPDTP